MIHLSKAILICFSLLLGAQHAHAGLAYYIPENRVLDWIYPGKQKDTFQIYTDVNGKYKQITVRKEDVSLRAKTPVDGVYMGWVLYHNLAENRLEHCIMEDLFENGRAFVFCDLENPWRRIRYSGVAQNFIGKVKSLNGFEPGQTAILNEDFENYKKGQVVKIRALFRNGTALILEHTFETWVRSGPSYNAISKVIDIRKLTPSNSF